jgi:hypothetical protein
VDRPLIASLTPDVSCARLSSRRSDRLTSVPYGIILLPEPVVTRQLIDYSANIGSLSTTRMTLGSDAPPHVSILHVDCHYDDARSWWEAVRDDLPTRIVITTTALAFAPIPKGNHYVPEGGVYYGLEVLRHRHLEAAHDHTVRVSNAVGATILSDAGENFRPHITLGILASSPCGRVDLPTELVSASFPGSLAFGELGAYGTFPKILEMR